MFSTLMMLVAMQLGCADGQCSTLTVQKMTASEGEVVMHANQEREKAGLPALAVDWKLMRQSRKHCNHMARDGFFAHSTGARENIAMGKPYAKDAVQGWMNSPGHRSAIMGRQYTKIGVAGYVGRSGRVYWCMQVE